MIPDWTAGERLFAQYAHAPNALGYCGPEAADGLLRGARGENPARDVRAIARGFSGAWPYQDVIAELSGLGDPLDAAVVRAYWTGNEVTDLIEPSEFGAALLARIKPQAGRYWAHLDADLLHEALPTHAFHVFAVYPWLGLLRSGIVDEPLRILDQCRTSAARVLSSDGETATVLARPLVYEHGLLGLGGPVTKEARWSEAGLSFVGRPEPGDLVSLHWDFLCDRLTPASASALETATRRALRSANLAAPAAVA